VGGCGVVGRGEGIPLLWVVSICKVGEACNPHSRMPAGVVVEGAKIAWVNGARLNGQVLRRLVCRWSARLLGAEDLKRRVVTLVVLWE